MIERNARNMKPGDIAFVLLKSFADEVNLDPNEPLIRLNESEDDHYSVKFLSRFGIIKLPKYWMFETC